MKTRLLAAVFFLSVASTLAMEVRVKDVCRIAGTDRYTLVGYGVIIGLAGTGDSDEALIQRSLANILENFNVKVDDADLKAQNCAAVMVTATVTEGAHRGDMISATVASVGDATSLKGGELLLTPMLGENGELWAVGQGAVITGGFLFGNAGPGGDVAAKNHPTTGTLTNGIKLLHDVGDTRPPTDYLTIYLRKSDYTTAVNLAEAINEKYYGAASATDAATVKVRIPASYRDTQTQATFVRDIEQLMFEPDRVAKVVFNERTGTIVFGNNVRISSVALTHGNISINIKNVEAVSQPGAFADGGNTERIADQQTTVTEEVSRVNLLPSITTVGDLVDTLNTLGVTPRDIMQIFHVLRESGALHAVLESM